MSDLETFDGCHGWLDNSRCRYRAALAMAEQGMGYPDEFGLATWSIVELVEAAVRSGQTERARAAMDQLSAATSHSQTDWAKGITSRCRALVCSGDEAERLYRQSLQLLDRAEVPVEFARAQLLYGEWLRRMGRRRDARRQLRSAYEAFESLHLEDFTERARRELLATGESVRKRTLDTVDDLTPQEVAISRLARSGYTNPEIGQRLYLSERTVEWHLRKVFVKLGIRSRRQLRDVLPVAESALGWCEDQDPLVSMSTA